MSTANILEKGWETEGPHAGLYFVTFSIHRGEGMRTYWYDQASGTAIEAGADPARFTPLGHDNGGAGGSGRRVAAAFKRAKDQLDLDVEAAGTDIDELRTAGQMFSKAVEELSAEGLEAAEAAGLLLP